MRPDRKIQCGFTLVEMVTVIVLTAILSSVVAIFISGPIKGYVDSARRAELTDNADTALRRIGRDLGRALPNSVRVTSAGGVWYLEYLEVRTGGRYRVGSSGAADTCPAGTDELEIGYADTCFTSLGNLPDRASIATSDFVVVYNLGSGFTNSDAYASGAVSGGNKSRVTATATSGSEDQIDFESNVFNFGSPGNRFQIVSGPVSYVCNPAAGTLTRYWGYPIQATQPNDATAAPLSTASSALLASAVSRCSFQYAPGVTERSGLVSLALRLTREGESVNLYHETHVSNVP